MTRVIEPRGGQLFSLVPDGFPEVAVSGATAWARLFIPGEPVPKGRHRSRVVQPKGGKPFVQTYSDRKTVEYEEHVARTAMEQLSAALPDDGPYSLRVPFEGRLLISLRFNMRKPVSYPASVVHHLKRPDLDNLVKSVLDGLQKGRVIVEDNQVTDLTASKRYEDDRHPEGVEIDITAFV